MLAVVAAVAVSCGKDEERGSLSFEDSARFVSEGDVVTVKFKASHIRTASVAEWPEGWDKPVMDFAARTIVVTVPSEFNDKTEESGQLNITGKSDDGSLARASLFIGKVSTEDMTARPANCYLVTRKNTNYLFDATRKGSGTERLDTRELKVIWQTEVNFVKYLQLIDGKASFYIESEKDGEEKVNAGNAVIGAYDAAGELVWSWHVWATDYDPEAAALHYANGYTVMDRNLGALDNKNSTQEEILASYGLYYQWGRKDPFIGPSDYKASKGSSATMYTPTGGRPELKAEASSAETGTEEYAAGNPLVFITGVAESDYDWLWSGHAEALWAADTKTVDDPCPYGWRVAPAAAFEGLSIADDLEAGADEYYDKYGWTLTDGSVSSLYIGAGRRVYTDGKIQNIYNPLPASRNMATEAQPWIGLYWTADMTQGKSTAFYFYFDKSDVEASRVEHAVPYTRANGMPVRCVRYEKESAGK